MKFAALAPLAAAFTTRKGATAMVASAAVVGGLLSVFNATDPSISLGDGSRGAATGRSSLVALVSPALAAEPAKSEAASAFTPQQREGIEFIIRDYLLKHPEVLVDVMKELENRQQAQQSVAQQRLIVDKKASIFRAPTDFVFGNPKGNVSVVEFFDYNCGWCKRAVGELQKLTSADPNVRVIMKELPIFGENSTIAAKAAMASVAQGKYWDFHVAMMKERQVTKDNVFTIAAKVGLDVNRLKKDMESPAFDKALKETQELAQGLGIEGTPGFIVDTKVNVGFVPAEGLRDLIAEVRKTGCQIC